MNAMVLTSSFTASLIRSRASIGREVWTLDGEVLPKHREQQLIVEHHRARVIAKGREGQVVVKHDGADRHSARRGPGYGQHRRCSKRHQRASTILCWPRRWRPGSLPQSAMQKQPPGPATISTCYAR